MKHIRSHVMLFCFTIAALLLTGCVTTPLTQRSQLMIVPEGELNQLSVSSYQEVLKASKLSNDADKTAMVRQVGERIARASDAYLQSIGMPPTGYNWEFSLIQDDEMVNAWCMPGGKVAVYTGILPITQDETGLAVVVGHEVAHALAKHGNERMSQAMLAQLGGQALSAALQNQPERTRNLFLQAFGAGAQAGVLLPFSRRQEYEADRIGLNIMAVAGYDPRAAIPFWQRMNADAGGGRPPAFLSTHPAPASRIEEMQRLMPEAVAVYNTTTDAR
jgi:predicted Zn-dependent protease